MYLKNLNPEPQSGALLINQVIEGVISKDRIGRVPHPLRLVSL